MMDFDVSVKKEINEGKMGNPQIMNLCIECYLHRFALAASFRFFSLVFRKIFVKHTIFNNRELHVFMTHELMWAYE